METILLGYCTFMSVVAALNLKRETDALFFLESFTISGKKNSDGSCSNVRMKTKSETTLEYLKSVSKTQNYEAILKCNI